MQYINQRTENSAIGRQPIPAKPIVPDQWDKEADVVIIGYGATGAVAAITVAELGGKVIIIEKAPSEGGNSSTSTGAMRYVDDASRGAQYLKNLGLGSINEDIARSFAETWTEIKSWFEKHGIKLINKVTVNTHSKSSTLNNFDILFIEGRGGYDLGCGRDLFSSLNNIVKALDVEVMLRTPAIKLVQNPFTKEILGIFANNGGKEISIKAKKAVIMACGGFAANPEMLATYIEEAPVKMCPTGSPYCTGDGIKMVIDVGADLWHMNSIEWAPHGFKPDSMPAAFWLQPKAHSWIHVNKGGVRFRDESRSLGHSKIRPEVFNCSSNSENGKVEWPNAKWYMIFDEKVRQAGPIILTERLRGVPPFVTYNSSRELYKWSHDNRIEIDKGWIKTANSIPELAIESDINKVGLKTTIDKYNEYCLVAVDKEHHRKCNTLVPINVPPYYAIECVLGIINTQGGPKRNEKCQVISAMGNPIPRLYSGGEFGSIWSFLYPGACNLSECVISGIISGRNAIAEIPWEETAWEKS
ncbi:MAG TPA: hypothetical protein DCX22_03125 [Dehalococcoidia bacterium]|nr:hypothetical protein [Dehalococcoidia bacterium]